MENVKKLENYISSLGWFGKTITLTFCGLAQCRIHKLNY